MKGESDPRLWRTALIQLKQAKRKVAGTEDDKFRVLKFSYDWLKNEKFQQCFLHCAMYPEDFKIQKEELVEYWIDEEIIDVMETRGEMKDEGYAILKKLEENCLLESIKEYRMSYVRMHDLVRDMAIHISRSSSHRFLVKAGVGLREPPENDEWKEDLSKVSLMENKIEEIPHSMSSPKCPVLTTLLLSGGGCNFSTIPEAFFEHMPELKVLDLSENRKLTSLPSCVSRLVKLTTLKLRHCDSLKEVPSLSNLILLKKLDLFWTGIEQIPQGLEMLTNLKYFNLVNYNGLLITESQSVILSETLSTLSKLQFLRISNYIQLKWEAVGSLCKLEWFYGRFFSMHDVSNFFKTRRESLHEYTISVGGFDVGLLRIGLMKRISLYEIGICGELNLLPSDVQRLNIYSCNDVNNLNDVSGFQDVKDLRKCQIDKCKGMEYVFSRFDGLVEIDELTLVDLENLKGLFEIELALGRKSAPPLGTFSSLERIFIQDCPKIKNLLPVVLHLENLKEIDVGNCNELEEIMVVPQSEEREASQISCEAILPKLVRMKLSNLPMLRYICSPAVALVCDSLEEIVMKGCPNLEMEYLFNSRFNPVKNLKSLWLERVGNLKSVFGEEAAESLSFQTHPPAATSFPLETVLVKSCPQLKKVFPHAGLLLGYLQSVTCINAGECDELEEIIASSSEEGEESLNITSLPMLQILDLFHLPKLKKVFGGTSGLLLDGSLQYLRICGCKELKRIPLQLPQLDNGQLSPPASLKEIEVSTKESWESFEWNQPDAKNVLSPLCKFQDG